MTDLMERVDDRGDGCISGPLPILLSVALGGSAVLLFAMSSGHLKGTPSDAGHRGRLGAGGTGYRRDIQPALPPSLFGATAIVNVAVAVFWLGVEGPHAVSAVTAAIGVALRGSRAVAVGARRQPLPRQRMVSATSVFGSPLPLAGVGRLSVASWHAGPLSAPSGVAGRRPGGAAADRPRRDGQGAR